MVRWQDESLEAPHDLEDEKEQKKGPCAYPEGDDEPPARYAAYSREQMEERLEEQRWYRVQATQNLLFLAGLQWWKYDQRTGTFSLPNYPPWQQRPVRNMLVPYFRHMLAKLTKSRAKVRAVPASSDPDNIRSAALADEILMAKWQELGWSKKLMQILSWMVSTGNAYSMTYWNVHSGRIEPLTAPVEGMWFDEDMNEIDYEIRNCPCDENGEPMKDDDGNWDLEATPASVDIGEVGRRVLSPFQVFVDNDAQDDDDVEDVIVAEAVDIDSIPKRWPNSKGANIEPEDVTEFTRFDNLVVGITAGADTHIAGQQVAESSEQKDSRKTLVLHRFERPSADYPRGRHWVTAGRNHLLEEPGELPDGIWPAVVHYKELPVPGQWLGDCAMTHVVGLQREYNEISGQIKEHHNLLLRGKWLVPRGSLVLKGAITTEPGQVLQHTQGMKPEMQDLKPLPGEVYAEREKVMDDLERITGVHQVSMGAPPPGITAGRAFLTLQEADNDDIRPLTDQIELNSAQEAWQALQLIQKNYEEERMAHFSGKNRVYQTRAFRGADLSEIVNVVPVPDSAQPWSKTAIGAQVLEAAKVFPEMFIDQMTGAIDTERLKLAIPVGIDEALAQDVDEDIQKALREEELFEGWDGHEDTAMVLPEPQMWQNHHIHMRQHKRLLDSAKYEDWDLPNQRALQAHFQAHQIALEQQLALRAQQLALAQMTAGARPGGNASAPNTSDGGLPPDQGANLHSSEMAAP